METLKLPESSRQEGLVSYVQQFLKYDTLYLETTSLVSQNTTPLNKSQAARTKRPGNRDNSMRG